MPIAEDKALEILTELIRKPDSKSEDIPRIWGELLSAYNSNFNPPVVEEKKKRRKRRTGPMSPNLGWPQGVSRAEYGAWKEAQAAQGVTEGVNPQEYKRLKDAGAVKLEAAAATKAPEAELAAAPTPNKGPMPAPKPSAKKK